MDWPGKVHDARVLVNSSFYHRVDCGVLLPSWARNFGGVDVPLLILGDPAYPLLPWLMKPYPETGSLSTKERHFIYHQSRAHMVVENAFGRLKGRWRCLLKRMDYYKINHVSNVVASCIVLHNTCEAQGDSCDPAWIHQDSTSNVSTTPTTSTVQNQTARAIRDNLTLWARPPQVNDCN